MRGLAPVEPKGKFIQISLQMVFFEGTLMRTHQPALNERRDTVYARQNLVGIFARATDGGSMMNIFVLCCTWIRRKPVSVNSRARFDMLLNKCLERFSLSVGDNLQAAASKAFGGEQLHGDRHQNLAFGTTPALAVPHTAENGLIYLNVSGQHVVPGIADCTPKPVQHRPSGLIRAKSEDSMQRFGRNAIFSGGQVPSCGKPDGKRSSGTMEYRARCGGYAITARITPPSPILHTPALAAVARWASKDPLATNPVQVVKAGGIIVKPRQKLGVVVRVVNTSLWRNRPDFRYA